MSEKLFDTEVQKLILREEHLDISKKNSQTAEVKIHKESITEEKTITVPIVREELVIEKRLIDEDKTETIRIPIKEERVEIVKHPVVLEDVSYHMEQYKDNQLIQETLKKERLNIETKGFAVVVDKETKTPDYL